MPPLLDAPATAPTETQQQPDQPREHIATFPGGSIRLPGDWSAEIADQRAMEAWFYRKRHGRWPRTITKEFISGSPPDAGQRSMESIIGEGLRLNQQLERGDIKPEHLADDEAIAVNLARRELKPEELQAEHKWILGMPLGSLEKMRLGFEYDMPPAPVREPEGVRGALQNDLMTEIGAAMRRAGEAEKETLLAPHLPISEFAARHALPQRPAWLNRAVELGLSVPERVLMSPFAVGRNVVTGLVPEGIKLQAPEWMQPSGPSAPVRSLNPDYVPGYPAAEGMKPRLEWNAREAAGTAFDVGTFYAPIGMQLVGLAARGVRALLRRAFPGPAAPVAPPAQPNIPSVGTYVRAPKGA